MNKSFDFYFDFISPYAFIAHNKIKKIEKEYMFKINYLPFHTFKSKIYDPRLQNGLRKEQNKL